MRMLFASCVVFCALLVVVAVGLWLGRRIGMLEGSR